jgi:hypothetical protein
LEEGEPINRLTRECLDLYIKGNKPHKIADIVNLKYDEQLTASLVRDRIRNYQEYKDYNRCEVVEPELKQDDMSQVVLKMLHKNNKPLDEIAKQLKVSPRILNAIIEDVKEQGYVVEEVNGIPILRKDIELESNIHTNKWSGDKVLRFALCGDNQENSKYTQITHLHAFYDILAEEGIKVVYHTGDIDEGEDMRQGHKYECYDQGADNHVENIARNYPKRDGIMTEFITGNHDWSILKKVGYDIGVAIAAKRPDMKYLGQGNAIISLTPNCTVELRHPGDGTAYAISYKSQKMIEAIQGGYKPNILAIGHYHKAEYIFYRNIHCFQTGCFQAQTPWMVGKSIAAMVGGWIVEVHVDGEGTITRCKGEFIPFYKMIKEDYKNWQ